MNPLAQSLIDDAAELLRAAESADDSTQQQRLILFASNVTRLVRQLHALENPMPSFDKAKLDSLVSDLEAAEGALGTKTDANTTAQTDAAKAAADLKNAQQANGEAVQAIKDYVASLDASGNAPDAPPAPLTPPTPAPTDAAPATGQVAPV